MSQFVGGEASRENAQRGVVSPPVHTVKPPDGIADPSERIVNLFARLTLAACLGLFISIAGPVVFSSASTDNEAESNVAADSLLQARTEGCTVCTRMVHEIRPGEFFQDVHDFACGRCHHPHVQRSAGDWKHTCSSAGCHPQAWTRTIFHRLDPQVFVNCTTCHQPHVWSLDGTDCLSCHTDIHGPAGTVPAPNVAGLETWPSARAGSATPGVGLFRHERHKHLPCDLCHRSETRHAELVMRDAATCMQCHHGPESGVTCSACHDEQELPAMILRDVEFAIDAKGVPNKRQLPFEHALHDGFECARCHNGADRTAIAPCMSCHEEHHQPAATCTTCHTEPARDAHDLSIHTTRSCGGTACHNSGTDVLLDQRNYCLVCHQSQVQHHPEKNCSRCHVLPPAGR